jgi:hypothetical protein
LREKLVAHRRNVVDIINKGKKMDGDAMAKVALIVAIQDGLAAIKTAHEEESGGASVYEAAKKGG